MLSPASIPNGGVLVEGRSIALYRVVFDVYLNTFLPIDGGTPLRRSLRAAVLQTRCDRDPQRPSFHGREIVVRLHIEPVAGEPGPLPFVEEPRSEGVGAARHRPPVHTELFQVEEGPGVVFCAAVEKRPRHRARASRWMNTPWSSMTKSTFLSWKAPDIRFTNSISKTNSRQAATLEGASEPSMGRTPNRAP